MTLAKDPATFLIKLKRLKMMGLLQELLYSYYINKDLGNQLFAKFRIIIWNATWKL